MPRHWHNLNPGQYFQPFFPVLTSTWLSSLLSVVAIRLTTCLILFGYNALKFARSCSCLARVAAKYCDPMGADVNNPEFALKPDARNAVDNCRPAGHDATGPAKHAANASAQDGPYVVDIV